LRAVGQLGALAIAEVSIYEIGNPSKPLVTSMKSNGDSMFPSETIDPDSEYYSLTLGADESGEIWSDGQTQWTAFDEKDDRVEIRELRLVDGLKMAALWKEFQEPFTVLNTDSDFVKWLTAGGHALIKPPILKKHMSWELQPRRCVQEGRIRFTDIEELPKTAFNRAPTPKLRMRVMKRDKYRCVLCGRRPSDHVDVELHVHHIRPFVQRGVTTAPNLVTLCHTCHKGLEPHYSWNLYEFAGRLLERTSGPDPHKNHRLAYLSAVERYRKALANDLRTLGPK
jgi:hypothetical protein